MAVATLDASVSGSAGVCCGFCWGKCGAEQGATSRCGDVTGDPGVPGPAATVGVVEFLMGSATLPRHHRFGGLVRILGHWFLTLAGAAAM